MLLVTLLTTILGYALTTLLPAASFFFFLFVTVSDHISRKPRCRFSAILPCSWRRNVAFYIESLQKPLTTMFPVTETQSSTRPQCLLNVLRRERILKADSRCFGEILRKNFKFACSQQLCEHLPLFIKSFICHIIYLRESRRRKSKKCRRMRRPTADFENTENFLQMDYSIITISGNITFLVLWHLWAN